MTMETDVDDGPGIKIGLSFIDIVSGGFGAAFFLFLVFASLPLVESGSKGGGSSFLHVEIEWDEPLLQLGLIANFEPENRTRPDVTMDFRFQNQWPIDLATGRLETALLGDRVFFSEGWVLGSSIHRERILSSDANGLTRTTLLRLTNPCPGQYRFSLIAHGTTDEVQADTVEYTTFATAAIVDGGPGGTGLTEFDAINVVRDAGQKNPSPRTISSGSNQFVISIRPNPSIDLSHCE